MVWAVGGQGLLMIVGVSIDKQFPMKKC
jgi:hypothetical protein